MNEISGHRLRLDRLSGWRLTEVEADSAYQAANRLLPNALRALRQAASPLYEIHFFLLTLQRYLN
ncbi:MAG: hypothetical protein V2A69_07235 [Pseudomonadota bacterium]